MKQLRALGLAGFAALLAAARPAAAVDVVRVQVWTADSLALVSGYFRSAAAAQPIALLLHDRGESGASLRGLAETWQALGLAVFLPDLRGEGASTLSRSGPVPPAPAWDAPARALIAADLAALLAFADQQPGLAERPWLIAAEGEACALALELMAGDGGDRFRAALLLSPLPCADLAPGSADVGQKLLLATCDQDEEALRGARALYEGGADGPGSPGGIGAGSERRRLELAPCRSRGARLLAASQALPARFLRWAKGP